MYESLFDRANSELHLMDIAPDHPIALNLAHDQKPPTVQQLVQTVPLTMHPPTFTAPDFQVPELRNNTQVGTGMLDVFPPFAADPSLPGIHSYNDPYGVDVMADPIGTQDPLLSGLFGYDQPASLAIITDERAKDSLQPDLTPAPEEIQPEMSEERPGNLAADALQLLHLDDTYQQLHSKHYPEIFMDQRGVNNVRSRHMSLLVQGLECEED